MDREGVLARRAQTPTFHDFVKPTKKSGGLLLREADDDDVCIPSPCFCESRKLPKFLPVVSLYQGIRSTMLGTMHQQVLGEPGTEMECDRIWRGGLHLLPPRAAQRPRIAMKSKALFFAVLITVVAHPQILGSAAFATESYPWRKPPSARYGNKQARQPTTYHSTPHGTDQALPGHGEKNGKKKPKSKNSHNDWGIPSSRDLRPLHVPKRGTSIPAALPNGGRVTLVGSGPGDPDLLTVAAHRLLTQNPDALVIADRLVSPEILQLVAGETKIARKLPGCADLAQEEIYWWVYQALAEGRHVIRLKIGDPFVFGRGGEEVLMFRNFGVEAAVIPVSR